MNSSAISSTTATTEHAMRRSPLLANADQLHLVLFSQDCNLALQSHGFSHLLTLVHVFRVSYLFHIRNELPAQSQRTKQPEYLYFLKCYLQHLFRLVLNLIRLLGNLLHRIILQVAPLKVAFFQMF